MAADAPRWTSSRGGPTATPSSPRSSPSCSWRAAGTPTLAALPQSVQAVIAARIDTLLARDQEHAGRRRRDRSGVLARGAPGARRRSPGLDRRGPAGAREPAAGARRPAAAARGRGGVRVRALDGARGRLRRGAARGARPQARRLRALAAGEGRRARPRRPLGRARRPLRRRGGAGARRGRRRVWPPRRSDRPSSTSRISGDRAIGLDVRAATRHYRRALDLAGPEHEARPSLLSRAAEALFQEGRYRESAAALLESAVGLSAAGDRRAAALAAARRADVLYALGDPGVTLQLEAALALLDGEPSCPEMVTVLGKLGRSLWLAGDPDRGLEKLEEAIDSGRAPRAARARPLPRLSRRHPLHHGRRRRPGRLREGPAPGGRARPRGRGLAAHVQLRRRAAVVPRPGRGGEGAHRGAGRGAPPAPRGARGAPGARRGHLDRPPGRVGRGDGPAADGEPRRGAAACSGSGTRRWRPRASCSRSWSAARQGPTSSSCARRRPSSARTAERPPSRRRSCAWLEQRGLESEIPWISAYALLSAAPVRYGLGEADAALDLLSGWETQPRPGSGPNYVAYLPEAVRTALAAGDDAARRPPLDGHRLDPPDAAQRPRLAARPAQRAARRARGGGDALRARRHPLERLPHAVRGGARAARSRALPGGAREAAGGGRSRSRPRASSSRGSGHGRRWPRRTRCSAR